ncbi:MAG: ATP synthase F0 subunit C [Planctomycetota bacterium]
MLGTYLALLAVAIGFGVALAAMGSAYGLGKATAAALEATGRQPEAAGNIRTSLIIGGALIEALTIYSLLVAILLWTKLPGTEDVMKMTFGAK